MSGTLDGKPSIRHCAIRGCDGTFPVPLDAPHKRFCSIECRNAWHAAERREARAALAAARAAKGQQETSANNAG